MPRPDVVAVVWAPHEARTAAFAAWLGAPLHNVHYLAFKRPWIAPFKYVLQWIKTYQLLLRQRPAMIYVTNSPPVAGLCVLSYCLLTRTRFVMDTHPPSLFNRKWRWSRPLQRFTARFAELNLLDQERFAALFEQWGAKVMVLSNPPATVPPEVLEDQELEEEPAFTYVGTFAGDEPLDVLLEAARALPQVRFYVLGDTALAKRSYLEQAPPNVTFTGYLVGEAYWRRLARSRGVVVLTTHAHSLLGAAQDARSVGAPLIASDQPTLREHFTEGTVFVPNSAAGLSAGLERALREEARLRAEMRCLRQRHAERWLEGFAQLRAVLGLAV